MNDGRNAIGDTEIVAVEKNLGECTASDFLMEPIEDLSNKVENIDKQKKL